MLLKVLLVAGVALCAYAQEHGHHGYAISEQKVIKHIVHGHHGELGHIGEKPVHHEAYAHAYPKYEFAYKVSDPHTGDHKGQEEHRDGDVVKGEYWLIQPDGKKRIVKYRSDPHTGFHADVIYEMIHHVEHKPEIEQHQIPHHPVVHHEVLVKHPEHREYKPIHIEEIKQEHIKEHKPVHIEQHLVQHHPVPRRHHEIRHEEEEPRYHGLPQIRHEEHEPRHAYEHYEPYNGYRLHPRFHRHDKNQRKEAEQEAETPVEVKEESQE